MGRPPMEGVTPATGGTVAVPGATQAPQQTVGAGTAHFKPPAPYSPAQGDQNRDSALQAYAGTPGVGWQQGARTVNTMRANARRQAGLGGTDVKATVR